MGTPKSPDAILVGGPRNGTLFTAGETTVVELEIDATIQRYLRTRNQQWYGRRPVTVFVYDGFTREGVPGLLADEFDR
ncbi:MAG TPA: hypothetical protein VF174_04755 [Micromonosporaceae bacterium]